MKPAQKRQKGCRYERFIAKLYREFGIDTQAQRMPLSGAHKNLKSDIQKPEDTEWLDECKHRETTHIWEWWKQVVSQCRKGQHPVLHIKKNYHESLTVLRTEDYMQLRIEEKTKFKK